MTGMELRKKIEESPQELYRALIGEYGGYVYAIAFNKLRSVCSKEDIDGCVSDVFAEIFLKFDEQKLDERELKGYIGTVAKRRAIDYFRKCSSILLRLRMKISEKQHPNIILKQMPTKKSFVKYCSIKSTSLASLILR